MFYMKQNNLTELTQKRSTFFESVFIIVKKYGVAMQSIMLALFLYLIIAPIFSPIPKSSDTILSSITLLSQFLFWGIWYGACLFSVIFFGRIWCGALCPLGALSQWVGQFGLKKSLPSWIQWDGWLVVMFFITTILGQTMDVRDDPMGMLKLFGYIFILAIIIGFIFGKKQGRPWCRYFCPIGKILGVVSRLGRINFLANHGVKNISGKHKVYVQGRLCPTDYNLPFKKSTNNCIACGKCTFKNKKAGMGVFLRKPGTEVFNILNNNPVWSEIVFILLGPGVSAGGFLWLILHQYQTLRDAIGNYAINHNYDWLFQLAPRMISSQSWNQHFNYLDILCITSYMLAYSLGVGLFSAMCIWGAAKILSVSKTQTKRLFISLCYDFTPIAILSIVIGLCGKFFQTMQHDFNMSPHITTIISGSLLLGSILWTLTLILSELKQLTSISRLNKACALLFLGVNILMFVALWSPAIFNYTYMSQVEMIRQHIITP